MYIKNSFDLNNTWRNIGYTEKDFDSINNPYNAISIRHKWRWKKVFILVLNSQILKPFIIYIPAVLMLPKNAGPERVNKETMGHMN